MLQTAAQKLIDLCTSETQWRLTALTESGLWQEKQDHVEIRYSLSATGTGGAQTTCDGQELIKMEIQRAYFYSWSYAAGRLN